MTNDGVSRTRAGLAGRSAKVRLQRESARISVRAGALECLANWLLGLQSGEWTAVSPATGSRRIALSGFADFRLLRCQAASDSTEVERSTE